MTVARLVGHGDLFVFFFFSKRHTVKVVVLVPCGQKVVSVLAVHDAIVDQLGNLKRCADGGSRGGGLEKGRGQAGILQDLLIDDAAAIQPLVRVHLSVPGRGPKLVLEPQIGLVADLKGVQLDVLQAIDGSLCHVDDVVLIVAVHVGHVESKGNGRVLWKPVNGGKVVWPDDHGVGGNGTLGLRVSVVQPCKLLVGAVVNHVVLRVSANAQVGRCAGIVCEVLHQLDGKLVDGVGAGEGEEVGGLDAEACKRGVDVVGGAIGGRCAWR